jgi:hypothetical protein
MLTFASEKAFQVFQIYKERSKNGLFDYSPEFKESEIVIYSSSYVKRQL